MKARYWPWRGVPAVPTGPASLCDTSASLCGERSGSVRESPGERPAEGVGLDTVPMSDEAEDIVTEGRHALEAAVTQDAPLQDAEPNLDLVDPGGMQRSVDKVEPVAVLLVEPRPAGVAAVVVQVEVVPDDVDPTTLVALRERVHEGQQCTRITVPDDATEHLARADVEGREQRACPATTVLELVSDDATMTDVDRVTARQRLHRLLVDAHDDGVVGRVSVEAADSLNLRTKIRVRRMEPVPHPMRAPAVGSENASDGGATHPLATAFVQSVRDRLVRPHVPKVRWTPFFGPPRRVDKVEPA